MDTDHLCSRNVEGDNGSYHNSFNLFASWEVSPPKGWLWRSWQSGCFRHHRSVVRIPTLAISYLKHIGQLISRRDQNKEKEAWNDQLKTTNKSYAEHPWPSLGHLEGNLQIALLGDHSFFLKTNNFDIIHESLV